MVMQSHCLVNAVALPRRTPEACSRTEAPAPTIWFRSWRQLAGVLSDENRALLRLMSEKQPRTVLELAGLSGRAPGNLSIREGIR